MSYASNDTGSIHDDVYATMTPRRMNTASTLAAEVRLDRAVPALHPAAPLFFT